jgi:hypothetical protein
MQIRYRAFGLDHRGIGNGRQVERRGQLVGKTQDGRYLIVEDEYRRRSWVEPNQVIEEIDGPAKKGLAFM